MTDSGRLDVMGAVLVREAQQWLFDANADAVDAPSEVDRWLREAPREEINRFRVYVKPNPCNDVAMYEAGLAHSGCPVDCGGCTCFVAPPCAHCVDHEPAAVCGCPFFGLEDHGQHQPECGR